jgi:perosamine synthetase
MSNFIPVYQPSLDGNELKYVEEAVRSTWIASRGVFLDRFESEFSRISGTAHATTVSNGTVALHAALLALGIGPGDEVIVPTFTYVASVNAINYVGATPVFCDIETDYWQMDPSTLEALVTPRTKAIIAVHLYGHPAPMAEIKAFADKHQLLIVEDCAEALGTRIGDTWVGNFGHIATYSFFGNKTITTGEGGMVVSNDADLIARVRKIKSQGLSGDREYWHDIVAHNFRMTNVTAAIGCAQLERFEATVEAKRKLAHRYQRALADTPLRLQTEKPGCTNSYWMVAALARSPEELTALRAHLKAQQIETRPLFPPVHLMPMYKGHEGQFPKSEAMSPLGMNLPSWPNLPLGDFDRISDAIHAFYDARPVAPAVEEELAGSLT